MASITNSSKFESASSLPPNWNEHLDGQLEKMLSFQLKPVRKRQLNTMIIGKWDPNERMVVVEVCKGTHLDTMGIRGRVDLLYPEEALFLVEKSRLCLFLPNSSEPASLEECIVLMLENGISLEFYLVYSHLKSLGNVVFRHGVIGGLPSESPLRFTFDVWMPRKSGTTIDGEIDLMVQKLSVLKATLQSSVKIASCTASGLIDFFDLNPCLSLVEP